jgi:integrase/recombinase XerD
MTDSRYSSIFSSYILGLVALKRAAGYSYETAEYHLGRFDRYCSLQAGSSGLSRELVLGWAKSREGESPGAQRLRMSVVRELGKYMQSLGVSDAFVLPSRLHRKIERHVPHFFTKDELARFFGACDRLKPHGGLRARHLVLPVFFRLLYCCGLRTGEARRLRVEEVDLRCGAIDILGSKWRTSRRLPLPQDLLQLFRIYDHRVSEIYGGRIYFFPTTRSDCYRQGNISTVFRRIWKEAGLADGTGSKPRAYDFRHHFALANLNRWVASGVDVNARLPYLSRYMGHSAIESTDYYLHLVPEFFQTFCEKVRPTEAVLPEVDYGKD